MADKSASGPALFVAREAFHLGGQIVPAGATVVAGHPLLKGRDHLFAPFVPTFGTLPEPASSSFAEKMAAAKAAKAAAEPEAES